MKEADLPQYMYYSDIPQEIKSEFRKIDTDLKKWTELFENVQSGQKWIVDVWDKYTWQIAIKIEHSENWKELDLISLRKDLLLKSRGGIENGTCIFANCKKKRVRGVVYCIDHLYETGARK